MNNHSKIFLISGGRRSGKSFYAEQILHTHNEVTYIATFKNDESDSNWSDRIRIHRTRRPSNWKTIEDYNDINIEISSLKNNTSIIIDSLGGLIYNKLNLSLNDWNEYVSKFLNVITKYKGTVVLVNELVGFGILPIDYTSNLFIDRLGELSQRIENIANESYLVFNGKGINLKKLYD